MIRSLRGRFLTIVMLSLLGTLVFLCLCVCLVSYRVMAQHLDESILTIYRHGGEFPELDAYGTLSFTEEAPYETRYFVARADADGRLTSVDTEHIAAFSSAHADEYAAEILAGGRLSGYYQQFRYNVFREDAGRVLVAIDCTFRRQVVSNVLVITMSMSFACVAIVFCLLYPLSRRVVRPFAENTERQRRFVTDASHELKTPLTIIAANAELIEINQGGSEWLESTKEQVVRLKRLIRNLVELAGAEEELPDEKRGFFPLSEVAAEAAASFETSAAAAGKPLTFEIQPNILFYGSQEALYRLVTILLDNAVKYGDEDGWTRLTLAKRGHVVILTVSNPCAALEGAELSRLFDRFYRADPSRSRETGGSGIGLSVARAIVFQHGGELTAGYNAGVVTFTAAF